MVSESRKKSVVKAVGAKQAHKERIIAASEQLLIDSKTDPFARNLLERRTDYIPANRRILISCEGEKTEPFYFEEMKRAWRLAIEIELVTAQGDPLSVVESALKYIGGGYDEIWAVFDKDDFQDERIKKAFQQAKQSDIRIAYSNESFELWYLLHFCYANTAIPRAELIKRLDEELCCSYSKTDASIFYMIRKNLCRAILHARKLNEEASMYDMGVINKNPFTGIFHIINSLCSQSSKLKQLSKEHPTVKEVESIIEACQKPII